MMLNRKLFLFGALTLGAASALAQPVILPAM